MVGVAQLVSAQDCDSWGCGFKSHHSPFKKDSGSTAVFFYGLKTASVGDGLFTIIGGIPPNHAHSALTRNL